MRLNILSKSPGTYFNSILPFLKKNFPDLEIQVVSELPAIKGDSSDILLVDLVDAQIAVEELSSLTKKETGIIFSIPRSRIGRFSEAISKMSFDIRFLFHPWTPEELKITVQESLKSFQLRLENKNLWQDRLINSQFTQIGDLSSTILHDLMGGLQSLSQIIEDEVMEPAALRQYFQTGGKDLILGLQQFRELCSVRFQSRESMWIKPLITPFLPHWKAICARNGVEFRFDLESDFEVGLRSVELGHVITNLVKNSLRELKNLNGGRITLRIKKPSIFVEDNGPGFKSLNISELEASGHGIGILLSKRLLNSASGDLHLRNLNPGAQVELAWRE